MTANFVQLMERSYQYTDSIFTFRYGWPLWFQLYVYTILCLWLTNSLQQYGGEC